MVSHPSARYVIREFPEGVRLRLGKALFRLQLGERLHLPHARPMPLVAPGVSEVRVRGEDEIYRTFYYTGSEQGILVLHAFAKKTQRTPSGEIETARKHLRELLDA